MIARKSGNAYALWHLEHKRGGTVLTLLFPPVLQVKCSRTYYMYCSSCNTCSRWCIIWLRTYTGLLTVFWFIGTLRKELTPCIYADNLSSHDTSLSGFLDFTLVQMTTQHIYLTADYCNLFSKNLQAFLITNGLLLIRFSLDITCLRI